MKDRLLVGGRTRGPRWTTALYP